MRRGTDGAIQWLLDGDPAIRWQTLRDVVGAAEGNVGRERSRVARERWGAWLLARQDRERTWAGDANASPDAAEAAGRDAGPFPGLCRVGSLRAEASRTVTGANRKGVGVS